MSAFTPTAAQRAAIESRGSAVLVSAGAGSGKTKVLTERLMGYLTDRTDPKDIDSFLVITFTRAAAGELKGRIMDELSKAIAAVIVLLWNFFAKKLMYRKKPNKE